METLDVKFYKLLKQLNYAVRQEGKTAFTEYEDFSIKIESVDETQVFTFFVIDEKTPYAEYPREAIQYIFKKKFEYKPNWEFMFKNTDKHLGVSSLNASFNNCIGEYKQLRDKFYAQEEKLKKLNLETKFLRLKDFSKVFNKNLFLEVDAGFYETHVGIRTEENFNNFAFFIKNVDSQCVSVELYKIEGSSFVHVLDFGLDSVDLKFCLETCYEKIKDRTLNLIS